jgi:hypothetical protein
VIYESSYIFVYTWVKENDLLKAGQTIPHPLRLKLRNCVINEREFSIVSIKLRSVDLFRVIFICREKNSISSLDTKNKKVIKKRKLKWYISHHNYIIFLDDDVLNKILFEYFSINIWLLFQLYRSILQITSKYKLLITIKLRKVRILILAARFLTP